METNRFFKELQGEKRVKGDQSRFDEILSEQRFKLEKRISTNIAENRRSINDRNFSFTTNNRTVLTQEQEFKANAITENMLGELKAAFNFNI